MRGVITYYIKNSEDNYKFLTTVFESINSDWKFECDNLIIDFEEKTFRPGFDFELLYNRNAIRITIDYIKTWLRNEQIDEIIEDEDDKKF